MTDHTVVEGDAGAIEVFVDHPTSRVSKGVVVLAHPHPLLGGHAKHKVPDYLARQISTKGWTVYRPNFRGVGGTLGAHDEGRGETDDLAFVCKVATEQSEGPLVLAGFSYGAYLQTKVYQRLLSEGMSVLTLALVSPGVGLTQSGRAYSPDLVPAHSLIVWGQRDERVSLDDMCTWAERCGAPVVVLPGADHFYNRKLPQLAAIVIDHLERMHAPLPGEGLS